MRVFINLIKPFLEHFHGESTPQPNYCDHELALEIIWALETHTSKELENPIRIAAWKQNRNRPAAYPGASKTKIAAAVKARWSNVEKILTSLEKEGLVRRNKQRRYYETSKGFDWARKLALLINFLR